MQNDDPHYDDEVCVRFEHHEVQLLLPCFSENKTGFTFVFTPNDSLGLIFIQQSTFSQNVHFTQPAFLLDLPLIDAPSIS